MNKDKFDQKGKPGTAQGKQPKGGQPQKNEQVRQGDKRGRQKGGQSGQQGPQRDQPDGEARRLPMGRADLKDGQGRDPLEEEDQNEEIGRPVRVGERRQGGEENDRKGEGAQWEDKSEGTSRQSGPVR